MATLHTTPFAGSWYPGNPVELEALLDKLGESSRQRTGPGLLPRPLAFVVPHAGLAYSGTVAASAYRHLQAAGAQRVFILGFAHRGNAPSVSIPDIGGYRTPLGKVHIDQAAAAALVFDGPFVMVDERRVCDHSVEIQLPMLQKFLPGVPVVPLYVGPLNETQRCEAARTLARHVRPDDVLLASSDLTHFGPDFGYMPFPANSEAGRRLSELDNSVMEAAGSLDPALFLKTLRELDSTVCGSHPVALLLQTLRCLDADDVFQESLDYQTSAEVTGEIEHSVSYGALGYFRANSFYVDSDVQEALLASAGATLRNFSATGKRRTILPTIVNPFMMRPAAVFVSLHLHGELFGCVGVRHRNRPLAEAVPELTLSAALYDSRFARRTIVPEGLEIEISVLTPMKRIRDWRSFRLGRDGAMLEYDARSAVLLPQVAGHGVDTAVGFLEVLSRKAGLRAGAYLEPEARLSVFRAQIFGGPAGLGVGAAEW